MIKIKRRFDCLTQTLHTIFKQLRNPIFRHVQEVILDPYKTNEHSYVLSHWRKKIV